MVVVPALVILCSAAALVARGSAEKLSPGHQMDAARLGSEPFRDSRVVRHVTDRNLKSFHSRFPRSVMYLYSEGRPNSEAQKAPFAAAAVQARASVIGSGIDAPEIAWAAVNCAKYKIACGTGNVRGPHPQVRWFRNATLRAQPFEDHGKGLLFDGGPNGFASWDAEDLLAWVEEQAKAVDKEPDPAADIGEQLVTEKEDL
eukprot:SAG31_NODE_68_length_28153_cov_23.647717_28_plen_201_part_00